MKTAIFVVLLALGAALWGGAGPANAEWMIANGYAGNIEAQTSTNYIPWLGSVYYQGSLIYQARAGKSPRKNECPG